MKYNDILVMAIRANTIGWILSPVVFSLMRMYGIINTPHHDYIIAGVLSLCSLVAVFLNFGSK